MAGRINTHRIIRSIHFFASLLIFTMALMYVSTGVVMTKGEWFLHGEELKSTKIVPLNYIPDTTNLDKLGDEIKEQFDISGRVDYRKNPKSEIVYTFYRPGVRNIVTVRSSLDSLTIFRTEKQTFAEISTRIHRLHGYTGGILYVLWAVFLDLTALSMMVFAITGILIWYRLRRLYRYGWLFIAPFFVLALVMYVFLS